MCSGARRGGGMRCRRAVSTKIFLKDRKRWNTVVELIKVRGKESMRQRASFRLFIRAKCVELPSDRIHANVPGFGVW